MAEWNEEGGPELSSHNAELSIVKEKLKEGEEELRRIISVIPVSMSVVTLEGETLLINKKTVEIFEAGDEENLKRHKISDLWESSAAREEWLKVLLANGTFSDFEIEITTLSGRRKTLLLSGLITSFEGQQCILSVHQDVTDKRAAEAELSRSREKYRSLVENISEILYVVDMNGVITYISQNVSSIIGYSPSELIGKHFISFVHLDDRGERSWDLQSYIEDSPKSAEYRILKKDGAYIWIKSSARPVLEDGMATGIQGIFTDISDLKKMEEDLRVSEDKYRDLADNAPIGILTCNREGRITYVNSMASKVLGSPSIEDTMKVDLFKTANIIKAGFADILKDVIKNGTDSPDLELKYRSVWGKELYLRGHVSPIFKGEIPDGARLIIDDITRRKEAEILLERTQFAFDHSPDEIYFVNSTGRIVYANAHARRSFGIEDGGPIDKTIFDINPEYSPESWKDGWEDLVDMDYLRVESVHIHPDGTEYPVDVIAYSIIFDGEKYSCTIARDITERRGFEDALKDVNKKLNLLSGITRHDILNQITVAAGFLEILELDETFNRGTKTAEYFKKISDAIGTIKEQILFTGYYKDMGEQASGWFDVGKVVNDLSNTSLLGKIELKNDIKDVVIFADPLFEKVIYNLIDNAVKYGEKITKISFYTIEKPDELVICCEDDGIGIQEDAKEKIFRREFFKNSGLGMFLSREILAITGLTIVETGIFGEGARFEIHVPKGKFRISHDVIEGE